MQKILLALGSTQALTIDVFSLKNFMNIPKEHLFKSLFLSTGPVSEPGVVTFSQCDDDVGIFTFDDVNTFTSPSPAIKGQDASLNLAGIFGDTGTLTNIHVHVDWNGTPLYDEDHEQTTTIGDEFKTSIVWSIPAFAPNGQYNVDLIGTG